MTCRNPRRETESSHSDAPLGNSRCRASLNSSLPASSSSERQYSGPVFSRASCSVAASMRSRTTFRSSFFEGQTSSRFLIWIRPPLFLSSFVMLASLSRAAPARAAQFLLAAPRLTPWAVIFRRFAAGPSLLLAARTLLYRRVELRSTDSRWRLSLHQPLQASKKLAVTRAAARDIADAAHVVLLYQRCS
jgi:hypothetical protein